MFSDDRVLFRSDANAGVLMGDILEHRRKALRIFDVGRIGVDRARERLLLFAPFLVRHIEDVLELGMSLKHPLIEMLDDGVPVLREDGGRCFDDILGLLSEHWVSPSAP